MCRRLYEAWDLRPAHLNRIIRHGRPSCRQIMGGLVATNRVSAKHAEVSPGEARSPRSFSRNNPRDRIDQIRGIPSKTPARIDHNRGNSKQMGQENRAQIEGTPSKMPRRTELKVARAKHLERKTIAAWITNTLSRQGRQTYPFHAVKVIQHLPSNMHAGSGNECMQPKACLPVRPK